MSTNIEHFDLSGRKAMVVGVENPAGAAIARAYAEAGADVALCVLKADDAVMTAMLVYLASEDPESMPRDRRVMADGVEWPECRSPARSSMESNR